MVRGQAETESIPQKDGTSKRFRELREDEQARGIDTMVVELIHCCCHGC